MNAPSVEIDMGGGSLAACGAGRFSLPQDDSRQQCPDIARARKTIGWKPGIELRTRLALTIAHFENMLRECRRRQKALARCKEFGKNLARIWIAARESPGHPASRCGDQSIALALC